MKRRALLSALVSGTAAISGCGASGTGGGGRGTFGVPETEAETPTETTTRETETSAVTTGEPTTTVEGVDPRVDAVADATPPRGAIRSVLSTIAGDRRLVLSHVGGSPPPGTTLTAAFTGPPSPEEPARVWLALRNDADRERTFAFGPTPPFSEYHGDPGPTVGARQSGLLLVPDDDRGYAQSVMVPDELPSNPACWRTTGVFVSPDPRTKLALGPGESAVGEYAVLLPHDASACLPEHQVFVFSDRILGVSLGLSVWAPSVAAPGDSALDRSVPSLPGPASTAWYHTADEATVYLRPLDEHLEPPSDGTAFLLRNFSHRTLRFDAGDWGLYKLHEGRWFRIQPWETASQFRRLPPGGESAVRLRFDNRLQSMNRSVLSGIGGGLYAVRYGSVPLVRDYDEDPVLIPGEGGAGPSTPDPDEPREAQAALVQVAGDPVGVLPTVPDERVERDEGVARVNLGDGGDDVLAVRRAAPDEGDPVTVIAEQANATTALRNSLGFFTGETQRVRLRAQGPVVREPFERFGTPMEDRLFLSYDGDLFLCRIEEP